MKQCGKKQLPWSKQVSLLVWFTILFGLGMQSAAAAPATTSAGTSLAAPSVSPLAVLTPGAIDQYGKFEISFNVSGTVATNMYFPYDPAAPGGVNGSTGINVDAYFLLPGQSNWSSAKTLPCFYDQPVQEIGTGTNAALTPVGSAEWRCRFMPEGAGVYQYKVQVQDAGGVSVSPIQQFTAQSSTRKGPVRVSQKDSRYFAFSDGTPFNTPLVDVEQASPFNGLAHMRSSLATYGQNGARFLRWFPTGEGANFDLVTFGDDIRSTWRFGAAGLVFDDVDTAAGKKTSFQPYYYTGQSFPAVAGAQYRLTLRAKVTGNKVFRPQIANGLTPLGELVICANSSLCSTVNTGWRTYTLDVTNSSGSGMLDVFLRDGYSENDNATGTIRVHSITLQRKDAGQTTWGPNILARSDPDTLNYIDQVDAARLDELFTASEQDGVYHKITLFDKNDALLARLLPDGTFRSFDINHFYSTEGGLARWYEKAYARYFVARWSYSSALHSIELANENDLSQASYDAAFAMAQYVASLSPRHILQTNSFWGWFVDAFWADPSRGNLMDYADKHWYANSDSTNGELISTINNDSAANVRECWKRFKEYQQQFSYNKPIVRGETGVAVSGTEPQDPAIAKDTQGTYYHKQLWAHVGMAGNLCGGDWYPGVLDTNHLWGMYAAYDRFMQNEAVADGNGHEIGTDLTGSDQILLSGAAGGPRAWGQRNSASGRILLWIDNAQHTWRNVVNNAAIAPANATLSIQGLAAGTYTAQWWDTTTGSVSSTGTYAVDASGVLAFAVNNLTKDIAVKFIKSGPTGTPSPTVIASATSTPASSRTPAPPSVPTSTPARTPTAAPTKTPTRTPTAVSTSTPTRTATATSLPTATATPSAGPIGYWPINEGRGTTVSDASGSGNNGTFVGAPRWTSGKDGQALSFDGIDDAIMIPDSDSLSPQGSSSGSLTVSAWVNVSQLPSNRGDHTVLVAKGSPGNWEYALNVYAGGQVGFSVWQLNGSTYGETLSGSLALNGWHHVAGTMVKGQFVRIYLDGQRVGETTALLGEPGVGSSPFYVARRGDGQYLKGILDEVRIYNRALSNQEIMTLAGVQAPVPTPTPKKKVHGGFLPVVLQ
jgi:hypothetical protein